MTDRAVRLITLAVALAIIAAGVAYAIARPVTYSAGATLVLTPNPSDPEDQPSLLDSFERSGTVGTYVELLASDDTLRRAGDPDIELIVRAIPGSRALRLTAVGGEEDVRPGLQAVIETAQRSGTGVGVDDLWTLRVLEAPSEPVEAGPNTLFILIATGLLALLGALVTRLVLRRWGSDLAGPRRAAPSRDRELSAEGDAQPAAEAAADSRLSFELEGFKYMRATPTTVLLQLAGYWRSDRTERLEVPTLLIHDGRRTHRLAPLVGPSNEPPTAGPASPLWRGSYAAPVEIFERHGRIAIQGGDSPSLELPSPDEVRPTAQLPTAARNGEHAEDPAADQQETRVAADRDDAPAESDRA